MKSYDQLAVEELRKINDHLKNACRLLVTLGEREKEASTQLLYLRNELYDYYRKTHPEDKEMKEEPVMIKDSGERTEFSTGAVRDMKRGVGRMDLLPWYGIMEVSKHCEEGAEKYGEHNVDKGIPLHSLCDSAARHLAKFICGELDEDHLRAACWNLLWALNQRKTHPELDDLYSHKEIRENTKENDKVVFEDDEKTIDETAKPKLRHLTFTQLVAKSLECDRVYCKECSGLTEIWRGWVNVIVDFDKNEIHLCPDLSKPNEWFYYDEGFVKCYDVNPFTGEKEG